MCVCIGEGGGLGGEGHARMERGKETRNEMMILPLWESALLMNRVRKPTLNEVTRIDEDISDAIDESAAQSWTHRCGHTVGMRQ